MDKPAQTVFLRNFCQDHDPAVAGRRDRIRQQTCMRLNEALAFPHQLGFRLMQTAADLLQLRRRAVEHFTIGCKAAFQLLGDFQMRLHGIRQLMDFLAGQLHGFQIPLRAADTAGMIGRLNEFLRRTDAVPQHRMQRP